MQCALFSRSSFICASAPIDHHSIVFTMSEEIKAPYVVARQLIDEAHRRDPAYLSRNTHAEDATQSSSSSSLTASPKHQDELDYADQVESWAMKLLSRDNATLHALSSGPGGIELVKLAARCQHLERFLTPRDTFPSGKMGYLKWRKHLYFKQADRAKELLSQAGITSQEELDLVHKWVSKTDLQPGKLTGDKGTQLLEDAAVLVFLQDQLADFAAQHQDYTKEKYISILSKTWKKLSPNAKEAAGTIPLEEPLKSMVAEATGEIDRMQDEAGVSEEDDQSQHNVARRYNHRPLRAKTVAEAEAMLAAANLDDPSSSQDPTSTFGSRLLKDPSEYMSHNAWDHVEPPASYLEEAANLLRTQAETKVPLESQEELYHTFPAGHWDKFYSNHENKFFKDRKWLENEFPELTQLSEKQKECQGEASIFEVGCGAGNTVFPLLQRNQNSNLHIFASDYSFQAVNVVKSNPLYKLANGEELTSQDDISSSQEIPSKPVGRVTSFVWDLSSRDGPPTSYIKPESLDIVVLIFVFSALHPREWNQAIKNCHTMLKKGGIILFRDYGRFDLPQLRFKKSRMLEDNFYIRGDGTRVYFFTEEELVRIFNAAPPTSSSENGESSTGSQANDARLFETVQLAVDRRMLVNRKENKQMYRCWMQAKFVKR
ncbi:unnamed protein product [Sympodiomycopsis kandeliae]